MDLVIMARCQGNTGRIDLPVRDSSIIHMPLLGLGRVVFAGGQMPAYLITQNLVLRSETQIYLR